MITGDYKARNYARRLAILLVTSEVFTNHKVKSIGLPGASLDDPEFIDYVELLSASNYYFDIINPEEITSNTFISGDTIRYAVVLLAVPLSLFSNAALSTLQEASYKLGVSLICSYTHADDRSKSFFGIWKNRGIGILWPLKVKIERWPRDIYKNKVTVDYGLISGLSGVRKRGFRKISFKEFFLKGKKLIKSLILPYIRVELDPNVQVFASGIKDQPLSWAYQFGNATNYYFALHGDMYLDKFNEMHRLVRSAIEVNSGYGMASVDLEDTMILRLDDPGACLSDYLNNRGILEEDGWDKLRRLLQDKGIPLSVMYTPCWVDDGDKKSSKLFVDNKEIVERRAGNIYDSARVKYIPIDGENGAYDHASEFRGLRKLLKEGSIDIHSHGLTHLTPDYKNWTRSPDKNSDTRWYHEFFHVTSGKKVDKDTQLEAMIVSKDKIKNLFGVVPCALTPSGHRHDTNCDLTAREAGYLLFSADYTGILKNNIVIRNWKIPSVFLYLKDPSPFASKSGYPVVGIVHDYEIKQGLSKFEDIIRKWTTYGIKRFISMKNLSVSLCSSLDARFLAPESRIELVLNMPMNPQTDKIIPSLSGSEVRLKVVLPEGMMSRENLLSIEGAILLSVEHFNNIRTLQILVRLKDNPIVKIDIPLQPIGSGKPEWSYILIKESAHKRSQEFHSRT